MHSFFVIHYDDVIITMLASQITSLTVVYSIVYSSVNQRKHQSSASLAFVREIHRGPVNFPHKWPVTRKMFPFDDVIMIMHDKFCAFKQSTKNAIVLDGDYWIFAAHGLILIPVTRGLTLNPAAINNHLSYKMQNEIVYPFPNVNGAAIEAWEWVSNIIPHFIGYVITHPCWDWS